MKIRALVFVVLICLAVIGLAGQKPQPVPIAPESLQKILAAYEAEEKATIALRAAQSERGRIVAEAMNEAQCWKCTFGRDDKGNLVFVKPEPPKTVPTP